MRKICVLIGDWPANFTDNIKFFDILEGRFHCKVAKKNEFQFETKLGDCQICFQFCFGPLEDSVWKKRKVIRAKEGKKLPPSIEKISRGMERFDEIYYFGFCGVLRGPINSFYIPQSFKEILFDKYLITEGSFSRSKIKKEITIVNSLTGKVPGIICSCITSNQVLSLKYVEKNKPETLMKLAKTVSKEADIVEMENYEVAKRFSNKCPLGIILYGGDCPLRKKNMIRSKTSAIANIDMTQFIEGGIALMQIIIQARPASSQVNNKGI